MKLIGATAHYVTAELDEGPIIEQDVARVDHSLSADDFTAVGRDVECMVLARAVRWHVEHRVMLTEPNVTSTSHSELPCPAPSRPRALVTSPDDAEARYTRRCSVVTSKS